MGKRRYKEEKEMRECTITVTITEDDLSNLKIAQSSLSDIGNSGIIDHIITLAEDKLKLPPIELTEIQDVLIRGLMKLNDVPVKAFNVEYYAEISELEKMGVISIIDNENLKLVHLNFDVASYKDKLFLDEIYIKLKEKYNLK